MDIHKQWNYEISLSLVLSLKSKRSGLPRDYRNIIFLDHYVPTTYIHRNLLCSSTLYDHYSRPNLSNVDVFTLF